MPSSELHLVKIKTRAKYGVEFSEAAGNNKLLEKVNF